MKPALFPAAVLAAAMLSACGKEPETRTEAVRPVRVLTIGEISVPRSVEFAGEVRARHEIRLSFRVGGKIVERLVEVGASVRAGQPIARLDAADLSLAAASAKAQAASVETERDLAAADLKRYRELREKNFISQADFDRRSSTLQAASARLEAAQALFRQSANQAGYAVLTADGAGVITALEAEAGQVVAAGQTVARLARRGDMEAAFAVPEAQRGLVENASAISVTLSALPGRKLNAKLRELSPAADPATRTYAGRATLQDAGDDVELGMSARVAVSARRAAPRIEVPLAALVSRGDQPQVFLVDSDGTVRPQAVKTAGISDERVAIAAGLKAGDVVVAAGAALLRAGQRVRVLEAK
ncbi:MAG: efflux RND transporter periplasmic adaptor subunit [Candidatus Parcubacteria bacterium]|nr:efflux RND transporter periplasmic adaptor subunit [Burkholderiales bacterium]